MNDFQLTWPFYATVNTLRLLLVNALMQCASCTFFKVSFCSLQFELIKRAVWSVIHICSTVSRCTVIYILFHIFFCACFRLLSVCLWVLMHIRCYFLLRLLFTADELNLVCSLERFVYSNKIVDLHTIYFNSFLRPLEELLVFTAHHYAQIYCNLKAINCSTVRMGKNQICKRFNLPLTYFKCTLSFSELNSCCRFGIEIVWIIILILTNCEWYVRSIYLEQSTIYTRFMDNIKVTTQVNILLSIPFKRS